MPIDPADPIRQTVVLVDGDDNELGSADKLAAHQAPGRRHRAFSLFVFDADSRLLIHRRAADKYHFAGLWTNSCCSHQFPGEATVDAARRRAREELGLDVTDLSVVGRFEYRATDTDSGLVEHELDHVVVGRAAGPLAPEPSEIDAVEWVDLDDLRARMQADPDRFTPWFGLALAVVDG